MYDSPFRHLVPGFRLPRPRFTVRLALCHACRQAFNPLSPRATLFISIPTCAPLPTRDHEPSSISKITYTREALPYSQSFFTGRAPLHPFTDKSNRAINPYPFPSSSASKPEAPTHLGCSFVKELLVGRGQDLNLRDRRVHEPDAVFILLHPRDRIEILLFAQISKAGLCNRQIPVNLYGRRYAAQPYSSSIQLPDRLPLFDSFPLIFRVNRASSSH